MGRCRKQNKQRVRRAHAMEECVVIGQREKQRTKTHRDGERARGREGEERRRVGGTHQYRHSLVNPFAVFRHYSSLPNLGPSPEHLARLWTIASPFSQTLDHRQPSSPFNCFLLTPRQQPPRWSWDLDYIKSSSWISLLARLWTSFGTSTISHPPPGSPPISPSQTLDLSWDLDYITALLLPGILFKPDFGTLLGPRLYITSSSRVSVLARLWTSLRTSIIASRPGFPPFPFFLSPYFWSAKIAGPFPFQDLNWNFLV